MPTDRRPRLRPLAREALTLLAIGLTTPLWLLSRIEWSLARREAAFAAFAELLSLVPGPLGFFARRAYYTMTRKACARYASIGFGTTLAHRQCRIGRRVYVGARCTLGMARIEEDVLIGSNVDLLSGRRQHHFDDPGRPLHEQGGTYTPVRMGRNAWIGNSAVVMTEVGADSVIGAGSVVVKPIPPGSVAVGNPARVVRERAPGRVEAGGGAIPA